MTGLEAEKKEYRYTCPSAGPRSEPGVATTDEVDLFLKMFGSQQQALNLFEGGPTESRFQNEILAILFPLAGHSRVATPKPIYFRPSRNRKRHRVSTRWMWARIISWQVSRASAPWHLRQGGFGGFGRCVLTRGPFGRRRSWTRAVDSFGCLLGSKTRADSNERKGPEASSKSM